MRFKKMFITIGKMKMLSNPKNYRPKNGIAKLTIDDLRQNKRIHLVLKGIN